MTDLTNDELDNIERSLNAPQSVAPSESETRRMLIELRRARALPIDLRCGAPMTQDALNRDHVRGAVIRAIARHVPDGSLGVIMRNRIAETVADALTAGRSAGPLADSRSGPLSDALNSDRLTDAELDSLESSLGGPQQVVTSRSETCRMLTELRATRRLLATPVAAFIRELEGHRVMRKKLDECRSLLHSGDDNAFAAALQQYLRETE
jgi:hypothetical protein